MRVTQPIFVNGFSRGGTTILTNLLASHPRVCLIGETHHAFKGTHLTDSKWRILQKCLWHDLPILMSQHENFFSPRLVRPRRPLSRWAMQQVDRILQREKMRSMHPRLNQFKQAGRPYTRGELQASRLLAKNIDGMIYATDHLAQMYPDASFVGLVRNGFALCEGHLRRGRSAAEMAHRYQTLVDKMLEDARRLPNYQLVRFEDVMVSPWRVFQEVCGPLDLDPSQVQQVRMQVRRVMTAQGEHRLAGEREWDVVWLAPDELGAFFDADVDRHQIKRLSDADRQDFWRVAQNAMEALGYSDDESQQIVPYKPRTAGTVGSDSRQRTDDLRRAA